MALGWKEFILNIPKMFVVKKSAPAAPGPGVHTDKGR